MSTVGLKKKRPVSGLYQAETSRQKICTVTLCMSVYQVMHNVLITGVSP
jgi:hypothetical protein